MWRRTAFFVIGVCGIAGSAGAQLSVGFGFWAPPCTAAGCGWWGPRLAQYHVVDPDVAVVRTAIKPKNTRLYLDGTFIGLATDFDGTPGYLYLERGRYELTAELGGYAGHTLEIDARRGRVYEIQVRMERVKGEPKEGWWDRPDRPDPLPRVYGKATPEDAGGPPLSPGPDLNLRPDLNPPGRSMGAPDGQSASHGASVRLRIQPPSASVYLDDEFLATGEELNRMIAPLAIEPGKHTFVVMAPGYASQSITVDTNAPQSATVDIALEPATEKVDNL